MQKRICWKKGMRLTDDIMRASDDATATQINNALALAAAGRFGLFPCSRPFQISLNITPGAVRVEALDCLAVTRGGFLIDVQFDTRYTNRIDNCIAMPDDSSIIELYLTVSLQPSQWEETNNGYEEPKFQFDLVGVNSPIADNAMPIAHLVNTEYGGWHVDEIDFVPPCLFITSHLKYKELLTQFVQHLNEIEAKVFQLLHTRPTEAFGIFWPIVQQIIIDTDKNRDLMTPMMLWGNIQKFVAAFTAACEIDEYLDLADANLFRTYALSPYNYKDVYPKIKEGLELCISINEKVSKIEAKEPEKPKETTIAAPYIAEKEQKQNCSTSSINIPVVNSVAGATVLYSTDGSTPSKKLSSKGSIAVKNSFNSIKESEKDQFITIKLKAILDGKESDVSTFTITLHKDFTKWTGIEI